MTPQHHLPADIERTSLKIIAAELAEMGLTPPPETEAVVRRVIHTTADFDYAKNLRFTPGAVQKAVEALHKGAFIVTDTNMALAGITKPGLAKLGGQAACYMADPEVARIAFDHIEDAETYKKAIRLCARSGITHMSNYLLYNGEDFTGKGHSYHADTPDDLYERMRISMDLCEELTAELDHKVAIFSCHSIMISYFFI